MEGNNMFSITEDTRPGNVFLRELKENDLS